MRRLLKCIDEWIFSIPVYPNPESRAMPEPLAIPDEPSSTIQRLLLHGQENINNIAEKHTDSF